ncbi:GerAB/ArcD/ProY family transporter [Bacillus cereus]|uniref:GerAB/ArcD/ProY family transporter n=1 Tax=Bacillus cereus TaxID=1396 RepID=UPI002AC1BDBE|nr:GerAB/ArcD/ProY family transporter [Bacillus cereus]MDZ4406739.1 GerAB/ArcD/ProY family transporter [Bacillus cereus]MDZ4533975.1 GerAB/ArcD/ProY family transporter [Bacillus cereus]
MIIRPKDQITTAQAAIINISFMLGAGILTLPRTVSEKVKTPDVWISVIIGGLISMVLVLIIVKLCEQFPNQTFYQYSQEIIGKWMGSIISLFIIGYFFTLSAFEVRVMAETTRFFLLQGTPTWAIIIPFLWIGIYLISGSLNSIARMLEIIFPITVIFFLIVMLLGLKIFKIDNLRPVLGLGIMPVLKGIKSTSLSFIGYEIFLVIYMFMKDQKKAKKAALIGITVPLIFYIVAVVMTVGTFSINGVVTQTWPILTFIRSFEVTGLIFERFDSLFLAIWIMQLFTTFVISYYAAALGLAQLSRKPIQPFIFSLLPVIYIISMTPKNINGLFTLGDFLGKFGLYLFSLMPILLLIITTVRGIKHEKT